MLKKIHKYKNKVLFVVSLILIATSLAYIGLEIVYDKKETETVFEENQKRLESLLNYEVSRLRDFYISRGRAIGIANEIINSYKNNDRTMLYESMINRYRVLVKENPFLKVVHFTDKDSITLMRMHWPENYGDDISLFRPIIKDANTLKVPMNGFEGGRKGVFYRVVSPVVDAEGNFYGSVEFGIEVKYFINAMKKIIPEARFAFLVNPEEMEFTYDKDKIKLINNSYLCGDDSGFFESVLNNVDVNDHRYQMLNVGGRDYAFSTAFSLNNYQNRPIIKVAAVYDLTDFKKNERDKLVKSILIAVSLGLLVVYILNSAFNNYIKNFRDKAAELEELYLLFNEGDSVIMKFKLDKGFQVLFLTDNFEAFTGYSSDLFMSGERKGIEIIHPEDRSSYDLEIRKFLNSKSETATLSPYRIITANGDSKWVRNIIRRTNEFGGEVFLSYVSDISDVIDIQNKMKEQAVFLETLVEDIPVAVYYKDRNLRYKGCNEELLKLLGFDSKNQIISKTVFDIFEKNQADVFNRKDLEVLSNPEMIQVYEAVLKNFKTGENFNIVLHKAAYPGVDGQTAGIVGTLTDVTNEKKTQKLLEAKNEKLKEYFEIMDEHLISCVLNKNFEIEYFSKALLRLLKRKDSLLGLSLDDVFKGTADNPSLVNLTERMKLGMNWNGELSGLNALGEKFYLDCKAKPEFESGAGLVSFTLTCIDITAKINIEKLSVTDKLTQIYNRLKLDETLKEELVRSERYLNEFSVILADIDKFKNINDTYGHQVGDQVLIEISNLIKSNLRQADILGRWGGEEFLIICPHTDILGAKSLAENLRKLIAGNVIDGVKNCTCSFGVASFIIGDNEASLIKRADDALYEAKNTGRNRVCINKGVRS